MTTRSALKFQDNTAAKARPEAFVEILVDVQAVLKSWKASLYSFEWLRPDGSIKAIEELSGPEALKRIDAESLISQGEALEKPVLGIGLMDNIEIGSGRALFLTLAAQGHKTLPVHIPASSQKDFISFVAKT